MKPGEELIELNSLVHGLVLGGHAAYRTQLFLYLKANGRDELNTFNLCGEKGSMQAAS